MIRAVVSLLIAITLPVAAGAAAESGDAPMAALFPEADRFEGPQGEPPVITAWSGEERLGLIFETRDVAPIPAYSGKPVNMRVAMDRDGIIRGAELLEHDEPIMLVGIPETRLEVFTEQFTGKSVRERVRVGLSARRREGYTHVDAVSGATVTVVVMSETIMRAARRVAVAHELFDEEAVALEEPATVREGVFEPMDWTDLLEEGAAARLAVTRGEVDEAFAGTAAEGVDEAPADAGDQTFIDLYAAYLNTPATGRNLLGEAAYERLMEQLEEGEHALLLMARGRYSFKGSGFVRGGIFDRIQLHQGESTIQFRDADLIHAPRLAIDGAPRFDEHDIFVIRDEHAFDPGRPWELDLLVRRQVGALDTEFVTFTLGYEPREAYFDYPDPAPAMADAEDGPIWVSVWEDRVWQIGVLGAGLALLTFILVFQDWLTKRPTLVHRLRTGFLVYTVVFIGWYTLAQLSVVNVLTFTNALMTDFQWSSFLMDPMIFILWTFVAATLLLWGRGVYCGWLCPFGAMQELINQAARYLRVPQLELPFAVHERLWAIKYLILMALFGVSLHSLATAEVYSEIEPFKTAVTMRFQREWGFILYAVILLGISVVNRKFFCRYMCPLGAGLAIPARLRLFDWLKRHQECGSPCQICAVECEVQAIHPDGTINANECHYCLDCQMTYWNDQKCPPMVMRRKKLEKAQKMAAGRNVRRNEDREIPVVQVERPAG